MSTKLQEMQRFIRFYKDETGKTELDMHEVAKAAAQKGWKLPLPTDPIDSLAKEFSQAAREEVKYDKKSGDPYRVYHAIKQVNGDRQYHLWIDIDQAPRKPMFKSLIARREQMVGDGLQITFDQNHWNNIHPDEEPIQIPMDFTEDIQWRMNAPKERKKAS